MKKKTPLKLNKCPLIDALVEIRFKSAVDRNATFGIIYNLIRDLYQGKVIQLPLVQIPEQIRDTDPNLCYKPLYRLENEDSILQIGPDVITISSQMPYIGWAELSKKVKQIIELLINSKVITEVIRMGHHYVNFFEGDILSRLNVSINFVDEYVIQNQFVRTEIVDGSCINIVQISNSAQFQNAEDSEPIRGSIIDIDTYRTYNISNSFLSDYVEEIESAHKSEKKIFYSLLAEDFIEELNPVYADD